MERVGNICQSRLALQYLLSLGCTAIGTYCDSAKIGFILQLLVPGTASGGGSFAVQIVSEVNVAII